MIALSVQARLPRRFLQITTEADPEAGASSRRNAPRRHTLANFISFKT